MNYYSERKLSLKDDWKYWSILKNFLDKKSPSPNNIPSLIVNDCLVLDFTRKGNLFNNFFTSQCSPVVNYNTLPNFSYETEKPLSDIEIKENDILLIIKNLNMNKAHIWDNVFICMMKGLFVSSFNSWYFAERPEKRQRYSRP